MRVDMLDVFSIAIPEARADDYQWFIVAPSALYPAAVAHVNAMRHQPRPQGALGMYWDDAQSIPEPVWGYALCSLADIADSPLARANRARLLECARLWFTEMLHAAVGAAIGVHITKDEHWRL